MPPTVLHHKLPLTTACHHYTADDFDAIPRDIQKYWHQRYSIFSLYDDGICLTDDAWFGVTPEPVANQISLDLPSPTQTIIDIFAGAGGNSISLALSQKWRRVIAVEKDEATLACAQHNAAIYGVLDDITWVHGDSFELLSLLKKTSSPKSSDDDNDLLDPVLSDIVPDDTAIFASPPWGGVAYADQHVFDLSTMEPYNLEMLHEACSPMAHALFLPRTSDIRQIARLGSQKRKIEVVQYCMYGASKAMVAYIPAASDASDDSASLEDGEINEKMTS
ncbi:hypothetical protein QBC47DRAFT_382047 [Echria macrotheca]|uniref:Trimethylguanosine synthase n=1 Tax=Echria macrotheca TaxID=438768 RepID=A0AAJ0BDQ3_9PEZI|nr:hypothetical protein QBC47DRAFT_382047 [Echria macrotheca]